ncbi:T9SS type A sorting domain-containing protein [Pedobacter sp. SD-b]|uniref:T9SS type A sorting domain-containing protein n=1 Tax=Pedobacter segetis TaxID=2793069 RepID=A0ABS1BKN2_9SPHI|nr:T9SS type A sorting domain-containing protein [Pedobacter segetis]MBK0383301.1 T9SS type A sorting domain-containing protein [Pedobacter segetis]
MKRTFTLLLLLVTTLIGYAQTTLDFETSTTGQNLNWSDVGGGVFSGYVTNPSKTGINTSNTVASILAKSKANGGEFYALINSQNLTPITFTSANCIVKMMVYKANTNDVRLKFEGGAGGTQSPEVAASYTTANVWQELTFNFSSEIGKTYASLSILADYTPGAADRPADVSVSVDNISFNDVTTLPLDFETASTGQNLNWSDVGGGVFSGYVTNPSKTGINTSNTVASILAKSKANGGEFYALINSQNLTPVTFTSANCIVKMMVYKANTNDVRLKFEGGAGGTQSPEVAASYTTSGVWQELTFDFSSEIGKTYASLSILADYTPGAADRPSDVTVSVDNITFNDISTLPIKLVSFTGSYANFQNRLTWHTASEINFNKFEIEKSLDGSSFAKIGEIKGGKSDYTFIDNDVKLGVTSYYQLKMIDNDGSFSLSNVVAISNKPSKTISISAYPIPATNKITLNIQSQQATGSNITIYDTAGRIQTQFRTNYVKGLNALEINTSSLKAGNYFLVSTTSNGNSQSAKFIIAK